MREEVYIKISGLNLSRLLSKLVARGVFVNNVITKTRYIKFSINESDLKILSKVCKEEKKFYVVLYRSGIKRLLSKIPYMIGTIAAITIVFAYMFSFSSFVYSIKLTSKDSYNLTAVEKVLNHSGVISGMSKRKYTAKEIERMIVMNVDDVAGCSVKFDGGTLLIEVYPETTKEEVAQTDLLSKYDAVITETKATQGILSVKIGDTVKKGDVLIKNDGGAAGEVKGKVYLSKYYIHNENQQYKEKTGKRFFITNLVFFNKISIKSNKKCDFQSFVIEKYERYSNNNCFLPIKIEKVIFHETIIKDKIVLFDDVDEKIMKNLKEEIRKDVGENFDDEMITFSVVRDGNYVRVDAYIEMILSLI